MPFRISLCPSRKPVPSPGPRLSRFDSRHTAEFLLHVERRRSFHSGRRSPRPLHHPVQLLQASGPEPGSQPTLGQFLREAHALSRISLPPLRPGYTLQPRHASGARGQSSLLSRELVASRLEPLGSTSLRSQLRTWSAYVHIYPASTLPAPTIVSLA